MYIHSYVIISFIYGNSMYALQLSSSTTATVP